LGSPLIGQAVGIKEVHDDIWLVIGFTSSNEIAVRARF
jgi:hypothetical protein